MAAEGSKLTGRMPALLLAGSMLAGVPGIAAAQEAAAEARSELGEDALLGRRFADLDVRQRVDAELAALRATGSEETKS